MEYQETQACSAVRKSEGPVPKITALKSNNQFAVILELLQFLQVAPCPRKLQKNMLHNVQPERILTVDLTVKSHTDPQTINALLSRFFPFGISGYQAKTGFARHLRKLQDDS